MPSVVAALLRRAGRRLARPVGAQCVCREVCREVCVLWCWSSGVLACTLGSSERLPGS